MWLKVRAIVDGNRTEPQIAAAIRALDESEGGE